MTKTRKCRTIRGLIAAVQQGIPARLTVYQLGSEKYGPGVWAVHDGRVHLNLGNGRYAICSEREYEKIKNHLTVIQC